MLHSVGTIKDKGFQLTVSKKNTILITLIEAYAVNFENWLQQTAPTIPVTSALAVLRLTEQGATVPFIARYRKEQTQNLNEVAIQTVIDQKESWDTLIRRQSFIAAEIESQGKLTPELKNTILSTFDSTLLEDIYLPFKKKKKTKATLAKEAGLEPLADWIWNCGHGLEKPKEGQTLELWAYTFRNEEKAITEAAQAIKGAQDILVERIAELQDLRQFVRKQLFENGFAKTGKGGKVKPNSKYEKYFDAQELIKHLLIPQNSHRYLAMRRGWIEEELTLEFGGDPKDQVFDAQLVGSFEKAAVMVSDSPGAEVLINAARIAYKAYVRPSIDNEIHKALKAVGDEMAIRVFAENVKKLLLASPFGSKAVLAIDPGIRTGCKMALIDDSGRYLGSALLHLQTEEEKQTSKTLLSEIIKAHPLKAIGVGNGTAGRETEIFVRQLVKELGLNLPVVSVNEAGASVYSASEAAREEFPDLDVTVRGAISIGRRLQDPLAELVKIDPKSIGVGQYQHDLSPHSLKKSLDNVVDSCVNSVGVNLNTASHHLLSHVSGIGEALAKHIVAFRNEKGLFKSKIMLLEVPHFSSKAFEQAAGFLRIPEAENPLDNTGVHPERYEALQKTSERLLTNIKDLTGGGAQLLKEDKTLIDEVGAFTLDDIIKELEKPGRDPRETFIPFSFRDDIFQLKDLKPGIVCPGIVTNVTNFGAFVDIGVHQDGLVHISQLANRFIDDPQKVVSPGDRVSVRVLEVNIEKNQISLTMKPEAAPRPVPAQRIESKKEFQTRGKFPHSKSTQKSSQGRQHQPQRPPKPAFKNDAFAALAALKKQS